MSILSVETVSLEKFNAFQIQSEAKGIEIFEASTPGEKLNILSLATHLSNAATDKLKMYVNMISNLLHMHEYRSQSSPETSGGIQIKNEEQVYSNDYF